MRFGIEIEAYGVSLDKVVSALKGQGISAVKERYNHRNRNHWKVTTDASISGAGVQNTPSQRNAFEVVSPILEGESGIEEAAKVCDVLTTLGAKVNTSCGLHVHCDASEFGLEELRKIALAWFSYEEVVETLLPEHRRGGATYVRNVGVETATERNERVDTLRKAKTLEDMRDALTPGVDTRQKRYHKLNLDAYWRHGTFEFRAHEGSTDVETVTMWIRFCLAFMAGFAHHRIAKQTKLDRPAIERTRQLFNRLETGLGDHDMKLSMQRFYRGRQKEFAA